LHYSGKWSLPGGEVDSGETYDMALKRELKEEINLDVERCPVEEMKRWEQSMAYTQY